MAWADSDYGYKKKITIDHDKVAGDETDFPISISVTDGDLADTGNGGHVESSSGYDIVFYDSTENTLLKHEIERYVNTNGLLVFWVKIPSISGTSDTDLYIYYGKSGVVADPSSTDTWDADFKGVYHLDETAGACLDSTANVNNGTFLGALPNRVDGNIGYGQDFTVAGSDYISLPVGCHNTLTYTYETWFKADSSAANHLLITDYLDGSNILQLEATSTNTLKFRGWYGGTKHYDLIPADNYGVIWHYIAGAAQEDDATLRMDGTEIDSDSTVALNAFGFTGMWIGKHGTDPSYTDGVFDEVRISHVRRSNNWMSTTYETQSDPAGFMGWGGEETPVVEVPRPTAAVGNPLIF